MLKILKFIIKNMASLIKSTRVLSNIKLITVKIVWPKRYFKSYQPVLNTLKPRYSYNPSHLQKLKGIFKTGGNFIIKTIKKQEKTLNLGGLLSHGLTTHLGDPLIIGGSLNLEEP
jgi:hypothetical protein